VVLKLIKYEHFPYTTCTPVQGMVLSLSTVPTYLTSSSLVGHKASTFCLHALCHFQSSALRTIIFPSPSVHWLWCVSMCSWDDLAFLLARSCSQCSALKHLTFNPTYPQKQKLFSGDVKDLVILPLLQEICKDKMNGLLC